MASKEYTVAVIIFYGEELNPWNPEHSLSDNRVITKLVVYGPNAIEHAASCILEDKILKGHAE